jgi:hypothetical protein
MYYYNNKNQKILKPVKHEKLTPSLYTLYSVINATLQLKLRNFIPLPHNKLSPDDGPLQLKHVVR